MELSQPDWLPRFDPNIVYRGGWLQTLSVRVAGRNVPDTLKQRLDPLRVSDQPNSSDVLTGNFLAAQEGDQGKPTVLLFHGMGGHARSRYMLSAAHYLTRHGYPVILWNNRGAGDSADSCAGLHHPGQIDDMTRLLDFVHQDRPEWTRRGVVAFAFSLGAVPLLNLLAQRKGRERLAAAVAVSAPLDMRVTAKALRAGANRLFDLYLRKQQKAELTRPKADLSDRERQTIAAADSVWELDDTFTAPRYGFDGAKAYYQASSPIDALDRIETPTLMIHAGDDPVVPRKAYTDRQWSSEGPLFPAFQPTGGHTGFLAKDDSRWHERAVVSFMDHLFAG